jgi:hypothetical protein
VLSLYLGPNRLSRADGNYPLPITEFTDHDIEHAEAELGMLRNLSEQELQRELLARQKLLPIVRGELVPPEARQTEWLGAVFTEVFHETARVEFFNAQGKHLYVNPFPGTLRERKAYFSNPHQRKWLIEEMIQRYERLSSPKLRKHFYNGMDHADLFFISATDSARKSLMRAW